MIFSECSTGWTRFGDKCYKPFENALVFQDAEATCNLEGSNLASIHSDPENNFVQQMLENFEQVLIGANVPAESSRCSWNWTDQTAWSYTNWGPGQPNDDINEQCVSILRDRNSKWNDVRCSDAKRFVCKKVAVRTEPGIQNSFNRKDLSNNKI